MPDDRNDQDDWVPTNRSDVCGDLLQRSLDHVEKLLERLEYAAPPTVAERRRREDGGQEEETQRRDDAVAESDRLLSQARHISEQVLAQARGEADALAQRLIAAAAGAAAEIHAGAQLEANDIVSAAHARLKRERATAEGPATEPLDGGEHEALDMRRHAWQLAQAQPDRLVDGNAAATTERELVARAVGTMRNASGALDGLATLMASESADLASTAATLESLLDLSLERRDGVSAVAEALMSCEDWKVNGNTVANGTDAKPSIGDRP